MVEGALREHAVGLEVGLAGGVEVIEFFALAVFAPGSPLGDGRRPVLPLVYKSWVRLAGIGEGQQAAGYVDGRHVQVFIEEEEVGLFAGGEAA